MEEGPIPLLFACLVASLRTLLASDVELGPLAFQGPYIIHGPLAQQLIASVDTGRCGLTFLVEIPEQAFLPPAPRIAAHAGHFTIRMVGALDVQHLRLRSLFVLHTIIEFHHVLQTTTGIVFLEKTLALTIHISPLPLHFSIRMELLPGALFESHVIHPVDILPLSQQASTILEQGDDASVIGVLISPSLLLSAFERYLLVEHSIGMVVFGHAFPKLIHEHFFHQYDTSGIVLERWAVLLIGHVGDRAGQPALRVVEFPHTLQEQVAAGAFAP